jgi:hypothetical protein
MRNGRPPYRAHLKQRERSIYDFAPPIRTQQSGKILDNGLSNVANLPPLNGAALARNPSVTMLWVGVLANVREKNSLA